MIEIPVPLQAKDIFEREYALCTNFFFIKLLLYYQIALNKCVDFLKFPPFTYVGGWGMLGECWGHVWLRDLGSWIF